MDAVLAGDSQRAPGGTTTILKPEKIHWDGEPLYHWSSLRSWTRQRPYWAPTVLRREKKALSQGTPKVGKIDLEPK